MQAHDGPMDIPERATDQVPRTLPLRDPARRHAAEMSPAPMRRPTPIPRSARASGIAVATFSAVVVAAVASGWFLRHRNPLTPESGLGYALGIAGGASVLLLLLYSARKRLRCLHNVGVLSQAFRVHMMLGVLAPVLILFHCNFRLGAPNSNVALVSMLVVAASGVVGRYLYTRISHGLYGARATREELHEQLVVSAVALGEQLPPAASAAQRLAAFAAQVRAPHHLLGARLFPLVALPPLALWVRRRVLGDVQRDFAAVAAREHWDAGTRHAHEAAAAAIISRYVTAIVKEVQFSAYERLFALWHALHIPLFVMLLLTGILHVVAVHMY